MLCPEMTLCRVHPSTPRGRSRLERRRSGSGRGWSRLLLEFGDFWMMRKMLLNVRDRAEAAPLAPVRTEPSCGGAEGRELHSGQELP